MDENLPNKVDQLFNSALQKFKAKPSDEVWEKIEDKLEEDDSEITGLAYRRKLYTVAAAVLITCLSVFLKIYIDQKETIKEDKVNGGNGKIASVVTPELNLHNGDRNPKMNSGGKEPGKNQGMVSAITVDQAKKAGQVVPNSVMPDIISEFQNVGRIAYQLDSTNAIIQPITAQVVESSVRLVPIAQPASPVKTPAEMPLTVTHLKTKFKDRLSVTPYFSKEFAGYSLTDNDMTGVNGQEIEQRERNVFSASVGFFVNYEIGKRWVLQSGLSYSWSNSNIDSATSYAVKDNQGNIQYQFNTISGYGYLHPSSLLQPNVGDSVFTAKSYSQLHYLTIPLIISYRIPLRNFSLLIGTGVTFNMLTSAEIETKTYGNGDPEKEYSVNMMGLNKINYGLLLKFDLEYRVNSRIGLNIIPCFKNTLSPINLESAVTAYPYNFGIGAGFTYHF